MTLADGRQRPSAQLLRQAIVTSVPDVPAVFDEVPPQFVYVPSNHLRALELDAMLVTGMRGAGKSFWWLVLQDDLIRRTLLDREVSVSVGFGQTPGESWPGRDELEQILAAGSSPRLIWKAIVLRQVARDAADFSDWRRWVQWVEANPSPVAAHLRDFDACLQREGRSHLVLFDALDRTAGTSDKRELLFSGLLQLVLELRGFRALRAKVFARPDMLEGAKVRGFPDASKVLASGVRLDWRTLDLYGLLFQYLGNAGDEAAALAFRQLAGRSGPNVPPRIPWQVPKPLRDDEALQRTVFTAIAGPYMGTDKRRGQTYAWVPNHLADGLQYVSPRSFLAAIGRAAREPSKHAYTLHWTGLQEGVRTASKIRVDEIQEDLPWAHEAMRMLEDLVVPCARGRILNAWQKGGLFGQQSSDLPEVPEAVLTELGRTGILKVLPDGRINIPDVYRLGFGLRRKGGFAPRR